MLAILADAIRCVKSPTSGVRGRLIAGQAVKWIRTDDWSFFFSFNNVCGALGLDPGGVRRRLMEDCDAGAGGRRTGGHRVYTRRLKMKPAQPRRRPVLLARAAND
jgi:hypothetical protein